ncbi:MAG: MerR family transcriptional regulator [Chloroflexota bacterium]
MLKIGMFARISQVSVKTLHYYEKMGLLVPAQVDDFTGYRYYSIHQLPRINRILALKDLGLSLDQIGSILRDDLSAGEIRGMLRLRQVELEEQVEEMKGQLMRVAARLNQIEMEGKMSEYDVVVKSVDPILVAGRRILVTENKEYPVGLPEAFEEAHNYVQEHGKQAGQSIAVWYTPMDAEEEDVEAAFPIETSITGTDRIKVHELPKEEVASVIFKGNMNNFMQGYDAILQWIEANDYTVSGPFREVYHDFSDRSNVAIEIQFPVEKA